MKDFLWYKVLYYWCFTIDPVGSGLTIPFLIGVEKEYGRGEDFNTDNLLSEFNSISGELSITIRYCQNIFMDVCSLDILNNQEKEYYNNFDFIYLEVDDYNELETFKEFQIAVKSEYDDFIEQGYYSINNGKWSGFTDVDLQLINRVTHLVHK